MKNISIRISILIIIILFQVPQAKAQLKKVGQAGMTYLSIPLAARETAMGDASVASVRGIQGIFYNPATLTQIEQFAVVVNSVNWLADTKIYGIGAAYSLGQYGTIGMDLIYMDYGDIIGTERVDSSVDPRGFIITGNLNIEDYAIGIAYAYPVSAKFSFGGKIKIVHEDLGDVPIAVGWEDKANDMPEYEDRNWSLNSWGFDVGGYYDIGFKTMKFAAFMQNYSGDMTYWSEAFSMPLTLRFGLAMDIAEFWDPGDDDLNVNVAIDGVNPIDYTGRVNIGAEIEYLQIFALRGGYQSNQDVFDFSLGFGVKYDIGGYAGALDYAYSNTKFFDDVNRFSLRFFF
jgi:hypothetical protein